jgi:hypothetical protein
VYGRRHVITGAVVMVMVMVMVTAGYGVTRFMWLLEVEKLQQVMGL